MEITIEHVAYLVFVIPGFVLTELFYKFYGKRNSGQFEIIAWSFVWGYIILIFTTAFIRFSGTQLPADPLVSLMVTFSLSTFFISVPLAIFSAWLFKRPFVIKINTKLFSSAEDGGVVVVLAGMFVVFFCVIPLIAWIF